MTVKESVKNLTRGTVLYRPLRDTYFRLFNRKIWKRRKDMLEFYSPFVHAGDLVFDVGANIGEYAEVFLELGARVVAVEPNPECIKMLQTIRPRRRLVIEPVALGASDGEASLYLCEMDGVSTLSSEWLAVAQKTRRFSQLNWDRTIRVPVTTLDGLIAKYGEPGFVKIDVEGAEPLVLDNLRRAPRCLSFEFNTEFISAAFSCLTKSCFSPGARFNMIVADVTEFALAEWTSGEGLREFLSTSGLAMAETFGEIFVREF